MIYNKEINGVKFTIVCESWCNRNSWGHIVTLYKNDTVKIGRVKIRYYNRTWESYRYQSAIKSVIYNTIEAIKLVSELRNQGISADFDMTSKKFTKQMEKAAKLAEYAIILGDDEIENNQVSIKDLSISTQQTIDRAKLFEFLN